MRARMVRRATEGAREAVSGVWAKRRSTRLGKAGPSSTSSDAHDATWVPDSDSVCRCGNQAAAVAAAVVAAAAAASSPPLCSSLLPHFPSSADGSAAVRSGSSRLATGVSARMSCSRAGAATARWATRAGQSPMGLPVRSRARRRASGEGVAAAAGESGGPRERMPLWLRCSSARCGRQAATATACSHEVPVLFRMSTSRAPQASRMRGSAGSRVRASSALPLSDRCARCGSSEHSAGTSAQSATKLKLSDSERTLGHRAPSAPGVPTWLTRACSSAT
mmetsp:Transcript_2844/g.8640  ORF Transcript_2844/g.8640 Transcript_2844/m.8640 type:complete len:278 (-) Transcript_2844:422-1255(-)